MLTIAIVLGAYSAVMLGNALAGAVILTLSSIVSLYVRMDALEEAFHLEQKTLTDTMYISLDQQAALAQLIVWANRVNAELSGSSYGLDDNEQGLSNKVLN